ncbi:metallophosphoesterase [Pediococcus ethanolidurans]|uniref:metallophosphoesterase n=1 Tax=Pediococcus ethanolidurans TaxID=319653 RepID=UPI001C1EB5D6|nr:metallophosphoesterase [Pediococcus ethanolidurans]MBU7562979.1 metallophosphoesterase [Pediococcus ethanolidurans]MCV3315216.1 metallophosphoesterase [Pediococcus ethanolidurans]MCV3322589.1 metallophosphoesterase [Pediococcus ethanolidurans]MCV3554305.1 metallophosphoesterase [Pediococcus ethanolidurans]
MKIAMTSDNHFDVNRLDVTETLKQQAEFLANQNVSLYLIAGDLFNDFEKSLTYVQNLQNELGGQTLVKFIAGNHDMVHGVTFEELESNIGTGYLHNQYLDLPGTDWRIIGNNGWYDYSFATNVKGKTADNFATWKRAYWIDGVIQQPMSDAERMTLVLDETTQQLKSAQKARKHVLYFTHFVPRQDYIRYAPQGNLWNMANAYMGSPKLGKLLESYKVARVLFGHMHIHPQAQLFEQTTYYNQSVGYHTKRINEWQKDNFMAEWRSRLAFLEV